MSARRHRIGRLCVLLLVASCRSSSDTRPLPEMREVTLPDLSRMDQRVQEQVRQRHASMLETVRRPDAAPAERGAAYGSMGILLQAGEYYEAAEPAYLNAQTLMPDDSRWPYYLAHVYKNLGNTAGSISAFNRVLALRPEDVPTLIWLGRTHLDQGDPNAAEPLFERAFRLAPRVQAVLVGLGQTALARRDFSGASSMLEQALSIDPSAQSIHSPLAMAYRGLGDTAKAEAHLEQWKNTEVLVPDPLRMELDLALESGLSYELRGVRALERKDIPAAAHFFRQGVDLTPGDSMLGRSLRHKLGTALYLSGDVHGAVAWFEETIRFAPDTGIDETAAKAHYSLGVLMASAGLGKEAIAHLEAAVRFSPGYVEAHLALADGLRRAGRSDQAASHYAEALRLNPQTGDARFGYGMALVRLGRYREARDWFADAARRHPDRPDFPHALARVLAAAPDEHVRDGRQAQMLVQDLLRIRKTTDLGETLAMALAELGKFADAVAVQRDVMKAALAAGQTRAHAQMATNLQRYERGQACRVPWPDTDPVHSPGPPVDPALRSLFATR